MGTLHIDSRYTADDGSTYTVTGDLTVIADQPASTGDPGSPDTGATAAGPAPDAGVPADNSGSVGNAADEPVPVPDQPDPGAPVDPTTAGATGTGTETGTAATGGPSGDTPAFPGELRRNDRQRTADPQVRTWQQQMADRGIPTGKVDGFFGPRTESGVRAFQSQQLLPVDGVIDAATWAAAWS